METLMEQKLTEQQAKMVIEYFAQRAAQDMPTDELDRERHLWLSLYEVSIAVGRRIPSRDWEALIDETVDLQSVDRDAEGFIHERGYVTYTPESIRHELEINVSLEINNCFDNSGA